MGKFPQLAANFFSKSDKMFLEQFFAYMLCYFKKYASTFVICKVVMLSKSKDFQTYMIYDIELVVLRSKFSVCKCCNM